ncbi:hypothetical protein XELAEV_18020010mg [Xenopus laevis]|uniref:Uncharacterized protein n=1 Tax=Xenopus laevis TaxID=8355 RepID=A0A974D646_XENLA|nr:hypothetical protein XELAEV_18020010mg [Xenopus laevis]
MEMETTFSLWCKVKSDERLRRCIYNQARMEDTTIDLHVNSSLHRGLYDYLCRHLHNTFRSHRFGFVQTLLPPPTVECFTYITLPFPHYAQIRKGQKNKKCTKKWIKN